MTDSTLVQLLKAGLLGDIADDQGRLDHAIGAATVLTEYLSRAGRADLPAALLASLDGDGNPDVDVLLRANKVMMDLWPTMANAFDGKRPTELLRAVLLDAVFAAAESDTTTACGLWFALRNAAELNIATGSWTNVVQQLAVRLDKQVSKPLCDTWFDPSAAASKLSMPKLVDFEPATVESPALLGLKAATAELTTPQINAALGDHVIDVFEELIGAISSATIYGQATAKEQTKSFRDALGTRLRATLQAQEDRIETTRLQQRVLWWRLGGYSDVAKLRYQDIENPASRAICAAVDLAAQCPPATPIEVEHLLVDTLEQSSAKSEDVSFADLAKANEQLKNIEWPSSAPYLLAAAVCAGDPTGLPAVFTSALPAPRAAVVLFRDIQTARLLTPLPPIETEPS